MAMPVRNSTNIESTKSEQSASERGARTTLLRAVRGVIDRRMLVSYRIDPDRLKPLLPDAFRPQLVDGWAVGSVCMIRLKRIRPRRFPSAIGISSENAAHRFAVEWNDGDVVRDGVFILRRDTSSRWNAWLGGRLFPGTLHHARFEVAEAAEQFRLRMESDDSRVHIEFGCRRTADWPSRSVFGSLAEASRFFERGAVGWSCVEGSNAIEAAELRSFDWNVEPLAIEVARSSVFDDRRDFPVGSIELDSAILMRGIEHEWLASPP